MAEKAHSLLIGGSIADRRMNCLASYKLESAMPEPPSSPYADEGTMLHSVMDKILGEGKTPEEMLGYTELGHKFTEELLEEMVAPALEAFDRLMSEYGCEEIEYVTEARVKYPGMDAFGTCDVIGCSEGYTFVVDWKFGRGVKVTAGGHNSQLKFYAGAARVTGGNRSVKEMFSDDREVVLAIIQPAMDEPLTHGVVSHEELDEFVREMKEAVGANLAGTHDPTPGKWCKFCRAASTCPAKTSTAKQLANRSPVDPSVDPDELGELLTTAHELEDWIRSVRTLAMNELEKGRAVTGWKLVEGRATRKWSDEEEAEKALRKMKFKVGDIHTSKLVSPAQAEKLLKGAGKDPDEISSLVVTSRGTTMAEADDPRPAVIVAGRVGGNLNLPA